MRDYRYGWLARTMRGLGWFAGIAGTWGVFFGIASRAWHYAFIGAGGFVVAALLALGAWLLRDRPKAWVAGRVHVVSASDRPAAGTLFGRCEMTVLVDAPGRPGVTMKIRDAQTPVAKWPAVGDSLPALISADDPRRLKIQWENVGAPEFLDF